MHSRPAFTAHRAIGTAPAARGFSASAAKPAEILTTHQKNGIIFSGSRIGRAKAGNRLAASSHHSLALMFHRAKIVPRTTNDGPFLLVNPPSGACSATADDAGRLHQVHSQPRRGDYCDHAFERPAAAGTAASLTHQ
jgi:hypothetical protein